MTRLPVVLASLALAAGCGGSGSGASAPVSGTLSTGVPSIQKLPFGTSAKVGFRPNQKRSTTLELTVTGVRTGRIGDLAAYSLDDQAKTSTPYYVRVTVANRGPDDVGGSLLPLTATTSSGAVVGASAFVQPFPKCRSTPLPRAFARGATARTCLVYVVPAGATLVSVSDLTAGGGVAATWTGPVKAPRPPAQ